MILAALTLLLSARMSDSRLTLRTEAIKVSDLLREISAKTGDDYHAIGDVRDERVVVNLHDVAPSDWMLRLAKVSIAEWRDDGKAKVLDRSAKFLRTREEARTREAKSQIAEAIAIRSKQLADQGDWDQQKVSLSVDQARDLLKRQSEGSKETIAGRLFQDSPAPRLAARVLSAMSVDDLARIKPDQSVTYSTRPNRGQREFEASLAGALSTYQREQELWLKAIGDAGDESSVLAAMERRSDFAADYRFAYGSGWNRKAEPYKLTLGLSGSNRLQLYVSDKDGAIIDEFSDSLKPGTRDEAPGKKLSFVKPGERPLELSPEIDSYCKAFGVISDPDEDEPLAPTLQAKILQPEKLDPLSIGASEVVNACADARSENLVACIPDDYAAGMAMWMDWDNKPTPGDILDRLGERDMVISEEPGWLQIGLNEPEERIDRLALGTYFRRLKNEGCIRLDNVASLATNCKEMGHYAYVVSERLSTRQREYETVDWSSSWLELRLYGLLSPVQRQSSTIPFSNLPPICQELIRKEFDRGCYVADAQEEGRPRSARPKYRTIFFDALEAMPNGISPNAWVSIEYKPTPVIYGSHQKDSAHPATWEYVPAQEVSDALTDPEHQTLQYELLSTGISTTVTLKVHYNERYYSQASLVDRNYTGTPFTLKSPPSGFKQFLETAMAADKNGGQ
jgi:hypothetical protein